MDCALKDLLSARRAKICEVWLDRTLAVYSDEYGRFVKANRDPFANPVGAILKEGLEGLFGALLEDAGAEAYRAALAPIARVRAVQEAPPSKALSFVAQLKDVVREVLSGELRAEKVREGLSVLEARIDAAMLAAFDAYADCRERIFQLRVNELKRNTAQLLKRSGATAALDEAGPP